MIPSPLSSGSLWHRWDPHIHAPGTVLNDQFPPTEPWDEYLKALEEASPSIRAIGVTDYYSTECYERVRAEKQNGRLPNCELVFPNVEMRLDVGTIKGRWVNIHLLVDPHADDHLAELWRFLNRLSFRAHGDSFNCSKSDLIRLGRKSNPKLTEDRAAHEHGCTQFKVGFSQLKDTYIQSEWAQKNILVAVAGGETDGTSGIRESADATLREEVEKFGHLIFASSAAQREFWVGNRTATIDELRERYSGAKACLHGSDAHENGKVGVPDGNRYSWVKGAITFDALRQACIDPAGRAFVGADPPFKATRSQVIESLEILESPWAKTSRVMLNPGLVTIIGARGSGKTALADMIALGCDAMPEIPNRSSFLSRAQDLLGGGSIRMQWLSGEQVNRSLRDFSYGDSAEYPRARYLSQQFVEDLCSADGMTDSLMREIERVIFEAHPLDQRDGTTDFDELLQLRATRHRDARERQESAIADLSEQIGTDLEKQKLIEPLKHQVSEKKKLIDGYTTDRSKLVSKGSEERVKRFNALNTAFEKVGGFIQYYRSQEEAIGRLQDEVTHVRTYEAPYALRELKDRHKGSGLKGDAWQPFLMDFKGDVNAVLAECLKQARAGIVRWKGTLPTPVIGPDGQAPYLADDAELEKQTQAILQAEIVRITKLINIDKDTTTKFNSLTTRINEENANLKRLVERLEDCEGAPERTKAMSKEREEAYTRVFDSIVAEQLVLGDLYKPLMERLGKTKGTLNKLSFTVARIADTERWAQQGEDLWDLRKKGPFKGHGTLQQIADSYLKPGWETGSSEAVSAAMRRFRDDFHAELIDRSPISKAQQADFRNWAKQLAKWMYSTDHLTIQYSIDYDGVDIRKLSPGTRGIVLLLLYLALDDTDDRPLIIDQPEENLDPQSIFDELVALFLAAKSKRQVIMVTHNANLVVNTDADQVIVASAGPHPTGQLPPITYVPGGLEDAHIRKLVCSILEGGERAFQERARRLRVALTR